MRLKTFNEEQLKQAVISSYSIRSVLQKLGLTEAGSNYQTLKKAFNDSKIDTSHFTGQTHLKGKTRNLKKRSIEEICVYGKYENTYCLKNRLIKDKIREAKCEECLLTHWRDQPIALELHHIDGDKLNNVLENLQILCANCHALTTNYRGKNIKMKKVISDKTKQCESCGTLIYIRSSKCNSCAKKQQKTKIEWPSLNELKKLLEDNSCCSVAKQLGVSDSAIRKRLKNHMAS